MKSIYNIYIMAAIIIATQSGCQKLVAGRNDNPNQLTPDAIDAGLFLNGAELSNIAIQLGPLSRMAGYYSGQLVGVEQVEKERYNYNVTNSDFDWDGYQSVITPLREIRKRTMANPLYQGITKVLEAHLIGTYASLFGDVPFSQAVTDIADPVFDDQLAVFDSLQKMLDEAVTDFNNAAGSVVLQDYIFSGNRTKWLQSAFTLKARYYMYTRQYDLAYTAAQKGISAYANNMVFKPSGTSTDNSAKNKIYIVLTGGPNMGTENSYMIKLLDATSGISRNNTKTNENARLKYYKINRTSAAANLGIAYSLESQPMITYQENLLILAEAGTRTQGMSVGLGYLNTLRTFLRAGTFLNSNFTSEARKYDDYVVTDFNAFGIENMDGIDPTRALLREIIEERYISGFTTFMPFDDARRLKKSDSDIAVPFPLNTATATQYIQRFIYPEAEILSNEQAPAEPGLYSVTKVNQ
ncbi:SusD/RagB family nutrient-binding outer membrane lipoprotein [Niastella caeni]|uniref:SusD/RagB family nutrient-binding outer membrane lipoprotein n=1 Tax=Niastella caeni TaxID=2569763 RepID=A0A4S8HPM2_9BACT|nr:SusD/RagB family nutrient-binding outer membrane lipoprotein [Niastella caeni]THU35854.1 SusD/RagB family nutrient-binding outer membrane lipoprotein [Niastella caeni]